MHVWGLSHPPPQSVFSLSWRSPSCNSGAWAESVSVVLLHLCSVSPLGRPPGLWAAVSGCLSVSYVPSAFLVTSLCLRLRHTRLCPWVCTCSSRVILLTLRITAGGIALPFGKKILSGKRVWIPGRVSPGRPLPCKQNHILPHLSRLSKGTVCPRASPVQGGWDGQPVVTRALAVPTCCPEHRGRSGGWS